MIRGLSLSGPWSSGDVLFEEEFMAHIVIRPDGATVADLVLPNVRESYSTGTPFKGMLPSSS